MANLNFIEKQYFEDLFGMSTGYVLDFTNRTFQEFIYDIMRIDIYSKYPNLSKAKILRKIIQDYDNVTVGKVLLELLRYMQVKNMVSKDEQEQFRKCADIGKRLIGKTVSIRKENISNSSKTIEAIIDYHKYLEDLISLSHYNDSPQSRGFAFEVYLKKLFEAFDLEPRGSFKIKGEQIDGSFILHNEVYLLEAKWTNKQIDKAELVNFNEKVSSKSGFTRGLFISFSGFTKEALETFSSGRTINIVLMTVQELSIMLTQQLELNDVLWKKVRALAEEGNYNKSIMEL